MSSFQHSKSAGRSNLTTSHDGRPGKFLISSGPNDSIHSSSMGNIVPASSYDARAGATRTSRPNDPRTQLRELDTSMGQHTGSTTTTTITAQRQPSTHAKLRKRGGSSTSLPGPPSPFTGKHSQFTTPFATYEEPFLPEIVPTTSISSTPRIKPYLRKMSTAKEDQGKLDLSKSSTNFNPTAGLGIDDSGSKLATDVTFAPVGRRGTHTRDTSVSSQISTGSGSFRPTQPFVHPMRQTPRPYTPPLHSYASSLNDEEANEYGDIVIDDDLRIGTAFRPQRSMSISSFPQPTPLSQSHTAEDLGAVSRLASASQTNLSVKSSRSTKSLKSKPSRSRGNTLLSIEAPNTPSSRTSFDKALSFVSRRSDPDPQSRDERIRAARRTFEAKEAEKERKAHKRHVSIEEPPTKALKPQQQSQQPVDSKTTSLRQPSPTTQVRNKKGKKSESKKDLEKLRSTSYDDTRPARGLSQSGWETATEEKGSHHVRERRASVTPQGGWVRFSAWFQTRLLECGGGR